MDLHPHLHLLVPSSSPDVNLEVRFYIPQEILNSIQSPNALSESPKPKPGGWSISSTSTPIRVEELEKGTLEGLAKVERLIIASHPWGRFGGNMLYPVIALHLISAALIPTHTSSPSRSGTVDSEVVPEEKTAVICYNVRGVGRSEGKQPWIGAGEGDYGAVERWGLGVTGVEEIWRFGYSWGTISATHAPAPPVKIRSMFLLSPPLTPLKLLRWYNPLMTAIKDHLSKSAIWLVYGSSDEFTKKGGYKDLEEMVEKGWGRAITVENASHFWGGEEGEQVREVFREWLRR